MHLSISTLLAALAVITTVIAAPNPQSGLWGKGKGLGLNDDELAALRSAWRGRPAVSNWAPDTSPAGDGTLGASCGRMKDKPCRAGLECGWKRGATRHFCRWEGATVGDSWK